VQAFKISSAQLKVLGEFHGVQLFEKGFGGSLLVALSAIMFSSMTSLYSVSMPMIPYVIEG
jgi:hypothetical protein